VSDGNSECGRSDCFEPAVARWHDGMWTTGPRCFDHIKGSLKKRSRFPEHRDEVTTKANITTIGDRGKTRVVPAGAKPLAGPWACIRTVEALEEWLDEHTDNNRGTAGESDE